MSRASLVLRSLFLLGFVLAMPLLALPRVARWADDFLYGEPFATTGVESQVLHGDEKAAPAGEIAQAVLEESLSETTHSPPPEEKDRGLDAAIAQPPAMPPTPQFPKSPFADSPTGDISPDQPADNGRTAVEDRLAEIRQRLEDLGAEYILLNKVDGTSQFHFQCRMIVAPGLAETETFEASGKEATAIAEQVLKSVEAWRANQASRSQ